MTSKTSIRGKKRSHEIPHEGARRRMTPRVQILARKKNPLGRFLALLGPGLITGASDDDPSGIGTYASAGARFGYTTLWTALLTFPLMTATQVICSRIGQATGQGVAGVLRRHYSRWLLYPAVIALLVANTINVGADIGAIAAAINLLVPIPIPAMIVPVSVLILLLQVFGSYRLIASVFKWLALALVAYIGAAAFARPHALDVLRDTFVPNVQLNREFIAMLVAILGTTISPYLWFWQASEEVEEEISAGLTTMAQRKGATRVEVQYADRDTTIGMFASNAVMYFIILTTAATLFAAGKTDIGSASDAAQALRPLAGGSATILLAVGLIGAGLLAVPVLSGSAAYALSEAMGWKYGLDKNLMRAKQFYAVIVASTLIGMLINFAGINPIRALVLTAVINGMIAPPVLVIIMLIAGNDRVMGKNRNGRLTLGLGWLTACLMGVAAVALLVTL